MAFAEEFVADGGNEAPQPTFLGVAISPVIVGVVLAVLGLGGAGFILWTMAKPVWEANRGLSQEITGLQGQIAEQQANLSQIPQAQEQVELAKLRREEMLGFFAKDSVLDTILLDFEAIVKQSGLELTALALSGEPQVISDGSMGAAADGRFKSQALTLNVTGTFTQVRQLLQTLDRFEPIVQVSNFALNSEAPVQRIQVAANGKIAVNQEDVKLTTTLNVQVVVARSQADIDADKAAAEAAAAEAAAAEAAAAAGAPPTE